MNKLVWSCLAAVACGTPSPPVEAPAPAPPPVVAAPAPEPSAGAEPEAEPAASEQPPPSEAPPAATPAPREVKYVMTGGKLEIVVEGVRFKPTAKAVRVGGGWGVVLEVDGDAEDDAMHSLLAPKGGPLSLFAKVTRKGGKVEEHGDSREGDAEDFVTPGTLAKLERKWPGAGGPKPLVTGDKLELQVGLWGIGPDAKSRRPVKKLLILSMTVGKGEPRALLAPPE
jgi:hypothetical protein